MTILTEKTDSYCALASGKESGGRQRAAAMLRALKP
jgi:hypothetical protein